MGEYSGRVRKEQNLLETGITGTGAGQTEYFPSTDLKILFSFVLQQLSHCYLEPQSHYLGWENDFLLAKAVMLLYICIATVPLYVAFCIMQCITAGAEGTKYFVLVTRIM